MENASKALIIAGSVLIAVMLIAVAVYLFNQASVTAETVTSQATDSEVSSFNNQFNIYETTGTWATTASITDANRYTASANLNTISDVITAVNLAVDINYQNNYGYKYYGSTGTIETANAVEVVIDFSNSTPTGLKKYYLIEPNKDVEAGYLYGFDSINNTRAARLTSFASGISSSDKKSYSEILTALNESKMETVSGVTYTIYKYYFVGSIGYDETTNKINSVYFTMVADSGF